MHSESTYGVHKIIFSTYCLRLLCSDYAPIVSTYFCFHYVYYLVLSPRRGPARELSNVIHQSLFCICSSWSGKVLRMYCSLLSCFHRCACLSVIIFVAVVLLYLTRRTKMVSCLHWFILSKFFVVHVLFCAVQGCSPSFPCKAQELHRW